jgi:hypothetical protein
MTPVRAPLSGVVTDYVPPIVMFEQTGLNCCYFSPHEITLKCITQIIITSCLSFRRPSILHWLNVKKEGVGDGGEILKKKLINSLEHRAADVSKRSVFLIGCIYIVFQAKKGLKFQYTKKI